MSFLGNLFSPPKVSPNIQAPQINFSPTGFSGGGLNASFANNNFSVAPTGARSAAVGGVASTFGQQASDIGNLRTQFAPGFSSLRQSLMTTLQNNKLQGLGNLRDSLAQRRVLGSSFAQNSLASADQEYQQQIEQIQAQTFLQELGAQQQLIQQQYTAARGAFQTGLDEMNLEAGLAADLTGRATSALASAATTQAQLDLSAQTANANIRLANAKSTSDYATGFGSFLGKTFGSSLSNGVSSLGSSIFGGSAAGGEGSTAIADALGLGSGISDADLIASLALV